MRHNGRATWRRLRAIAGWVGYRSAVGWAARPTVREWLLGLITLLVTVMGAVTIALVELVVGDISQAYRIDRGVHFDHSTDALITWRVALTLATLVTTVVLLHARDRILRSRSTLYYVSALEAGMTDWHAAFAANHSVRQGHLDMRTIRRRVRPAEAIPGDISEFVRELSHDFELIMNDDDSGTGFDIAPNMLWPVAFAVGYNTEFWPNTRLNELVNFHHGTDRGTSPLGMRWRLRERPFLAADRAGLHVREIQRRPPGSPAADVRSVLVIASLVHARARSARLDPKTVPADVTLVVEGQRSGTGPSRMAEGVTMSSRPFSPLLHPWVAAHELAHHIAWAQHTYPDATLFLALKVPKTVALAVGWILSDAGHFGRPLDGHGLADRGACRLPVCGNRLRNMVLLHNRDGWQPVRVHHQQMPWVEQQRRLAELTATPPAPATVKRHRRRPTTTPRIPTVSREFT